MRKIVIMRGPQGSGKSAIVKAAGLEAHVLSMDAIREAIGGATLGTDGTFGVNQDDNDRVWRLAQESLDRRLARGETLAYDATLPAAKEVEDIAGKARAAGYQVLVVDRYGCNAEATIARAWDRPERLRVPRHSVERTIRQAATTRPLDEMLEVVRTGDDLQASIEAVRDFLRRGTEIVDLSRYDRIIHVGDLQGCLTPLLDPASPVAQALDDESVFFVFHGDLADRGIENGAVIRWWLENMLGRKNKAFIAGNHEDHLEFESRGLDPVSREFALRTLPQLREAGITREDLAALIAEAVPFLAYEWRGRRVLASHAGFPRWPEPMWLVPDFQLRKGSGHYQTPVDEAWDGWARSVEAEACVELWQVHGHRNQRMIPVINGRSINLEGQCEFGGHLRIAVLGEDGWSPIEIRNTIHRTMQEFRMNDVAEGRPSYGKACPIAPWAAEGRIAPRPVPRESLDAFLAHEAVAEHRCTVPGLEHVASLNFTKQAFWDKSWDDLNIHARGLFVDMESGCVIARSYLKFFNHGERRETQDTALEKNLAFPVTLFDKSNGFLGLAGYDERTGQLVVTSKSRVDGDFADWAREILAEQLGAGGIERLTRFCRDQVASCVFEIIDPERDPHIIEEPQRKAVLLDAVHRDETFQAMPYDDLVKLADHLGCPVKSVQCVLPNWRALSTVMHRMENDLDWKPSRDGGYSEGAVVVDANGFMFKVKAKHYAFWKHMRGAKDRVLKSRRTGVPMDMTRYEDPLALAFLAFCEKQPDDVLDLDIITLRKAFQADPETVLHIAMEPPAPKVPDQTGFLKGVDAIAAQVASGSAKAETVRRLVGRAGECPHRLAAFDGHPAAAELRAFAAQ